MSSTSSRIKGSSGNTSSVEDDDAILHPSELVGREQMISLGCRWSMERDHVRGREQVIKSRVAEAEMLGEPRIDHHVLGEYIHFESLGDASLASSFFSVS